MLRGTNLTGGDTLWSTHPATGPVSGQHYQFVSTADVDYLISKGMNCFRLVFGWEAIQPKPYQNPTTNTGNWKIYWDKAKALVDYITSKGCVCVLDIHGGNDSTFGAYRGVRIGNKLPTGEAVADLFENLWWYLAKVFKDNQLVYFGFMNEPLPATTAAWYTCAQKTINTIRTSVGARNKIVCPGVAYTGAGSWYTSGNAAAWNLADTANNLAVQVHLYVNADGSGLTTDIVSPDIGWERLKSTVDWCRAMRLQCFLGEVAMDGNNPASVECWRRLNAYMEANSDVLLGWAWWAYGGAWWKGYKFTLSQQPGDSAEMDLIEASLLGPPVPVDPTIALKAEIELLKGNISVLTQDHDLLVKQLADETALVLSLQTELAECRSRLLSVQNDNSEYCAAMLAIEELVRGVL